MNEILFSWGMLLLSVAANAFGVFVIKLRINELGPVKFDLFSNVVRYFVMLLKTPLVMFGLVFFFVAPFLFAIALSRLEISVAYPVQVGLNFAILLILAVLFLGEHVGLYKFIGIFFIMLGILILQRVH